MHVAQRHPVFAEDRGASRQHTRPVDGVEAHVERGFRVSDRRDIAACVRLLEVPHGAARTVPCGGDHVTHHRGCRGGATGALPQEHQLPGLARIDEDGVEGA